MPLAATKMPGRSTKPTCIGSGFIALDLVMREKSDAPIARHAGGSCGNVMAILAFLGWNSTPVARLKHDKEASDVIADLRAFQVRTKFLFQEDAGVTPIVVQRIQTGRNGLPIHKFEWRLPSTGQRLPMYRPMPQRIALEVLDSLPQCDVFYFDRAEKSSLLIAKRMKERGAVVFFEPSSVKNPDIFSECLAASDIVKYSSERISNIPSSSSYFKPVLEIQTLGSDGLRYRFKENGVNWSKWIKRPSIQTAHFVDACGSGDWCSAGIINSLCRASSQNLDTVSLKQVDDAIRFGQALATINCQYEGARGAMYKYQSSPIKLKKFAISLLKDQ